MSPSRTRPSATGARSKRSVSTPSPWLPSCPSICGGSARPANSTQRRSAVSDRPSASAASPASSVSNRQRDQPERSHDDAPPREQAKTVALHVVEKRLHHDPSAHERYRKSESHDHGVVHAHLAAALVEIVGERAGHGG